jgi:hypothetical protein
MNFPFNVKFAIFDENKEITKNQTELRKKLIWDDLRNIIKEIFNNDNNYKWLDRTEASVSSNDEKKQLRLSICGSKIEGKKYQHSIHFNQNHTASKEYFTMEELKYISGKIKNGLEDFLHYEIDEPIIYINMDEL